MFNLAKLFLPLAMASAFNLASCVAGGEVQDHFKIISKPNKVSIFYKDEFVGETPFVFYFKEQSQITLKAMKPGYYTEVFTVYKAFHVTDDSSAACKASTVYSWAFLNIPYQLGKFNNSKSRHCGSYYPIIEIDLFEIKN